MYSPQRGKPMMAVSRILILTHSNAVTLQGYFLARLVNKWKKFNRELTRRAPPSIPFQQPSITSKQDYRIFPERGMLPVGWLDRDDIVVERFRPERFGDSYVLREWYFLGDREVCRCETSSDPISTYGEWCPSLDAPPPHSIRQVREDLRIDYGKIDYAIDGDGVPVLFDVNKDHWRWDQGLRMDAEN